MVGYILGIGDRHLSNILLDEKTGEVIHIDLGVAFDQGKAQKIPERVPFRLTNEIINGMGVGGKDGVFRRACEETLHILRNYSEYLLIVLDVFMSDPLYNWNVIPIKNKENISEEMDNCNLSAESVIIQCRRKLEGREMGEVSCVEGQVTKLINEAIDPDNLCLMFKGWKPYL